MTRTISCCLVVLGLTLHATSVNAQYLVERLVPPQQVPLSPLPMVKVPAEPKIFGAEKDRQHLWSLPFGVFPGTSTTLKTEQLPVNWARPALDIPSLASEIDPAQSRYPMQPVSPRTFVVSADPLRTPAVARFPIPGEPLVKPDEDPSSSSAFQVLTAAVPLANPNPAPLLRLSIPDPFEQIRVIRLAVPPADADPSSVAQLRPPLQKLPNVEAPK